MQAQINPHFLYNTLETISWLAAQLSNSKNKVSAALLMLAKIFRHTNDTESFLIIIHNETEYAKLYSGILKLRYKDMFHMEWDIDPEIIGYKTVKMFLQPLIENSVYHGIKPTGIKGTIKIKGEFVQGGILFTVSDDGAGISQDIENDINSNLNDNYTMPNNHIGLGNVNQRIKFICGER